MINVVDFATVSYATQVVVGDQLTCKNVRGAKRWRASDLTDLEQLNWANEVPGNVNNTHTIIMSKHCNLSR